MKGKVFRTVSLVAVLFGMLSVAPSVPAGVQVAPIGAISTAEAAVSKSLGGGGGGNVSGAGDRFGDLLSGWAVPVLTVLAGCLLIGTLASRNMGAAFGIVLITLVGLIFLLSPQSIESLAKGVANTVF
jgi:hypothetical protein